MLLLLVLRACLSWLLLQCGRQSVGHWVQPLCLPLRLLLCHQLMQCVQP
jgi:hypothetical protein